MTLNTRSITGFFGHAFFFTLAIIALVFYKERMLAYDPGFFSFMMIEDETFSVALGRWGSVFSQVLPILGLKAGISLESFLQLFSVSFILLYYIYFLLIHYVYKNTRASVVLILTLCLTFRSTFYYSTAELYQALGLSVLFWAVLEKALEQKKTINFHFVFAIMLIVLVSFFHQLAAIPLLFILGYEYISRENWKSYPNLILIAVVLIWFVIRVKLLTTSQYEKEKMPELKDFFSIRDLFKSEELAHIRHFLKYVLFIPWITGLTVMVIMFFKKKRLLSLYTGLCVVGFVFLVMVTLKKGDSVVMSENYFTILGLFIAIPLVTEFFTRFPLRTLGISAALTIYSILAICGSHYFLTNRVKFLNNLVAYGQQFEGRKLVVKLDKITDRTSVAWALPFETLLLSSINSSYQSTTIFPTNDFVKFSGDTLTKENVFLGPTWEPFWFASNSMDPYYFSLPSGDYVNVSSSQSDTSFHEASFTPENFKIEANGKFVADNEYFIAEVLLNNQSDFLLPSIVTEKEHVHISYHLYSSDGKLVKWDNVRSELTVDVFPHKSFIQAVKIEQLEKGEYELEFDLVTEGKRWWGINKRSKLIVD